MKVHSDLCFHMAVNSARLRGVESVAFPTSSIMSVRVNCYRHLFRTHFLFSIRTVKKARSGCTYTDSGKGDKYRKVIRHGVLRHDARRIHGSDRDCGLVAANGIVVDLGCTLFRIVRGRAESDGEIVLTAHIRTVSMVVLDVSNEVCRLTVEVTKQHKSPSNLPQRFQHPSD